MKALVLEEKERMIVKDIPIPELKEDEVLVQVKYCGVCGTDVHIFHGDPGSAQVIAPIVQGHEFAGIVEKVGADVTTIKTGDHVAIDPNIYCGKCSYCKQGRVQLCKHLQALGVTRNGGMAEFSAVPEANCLLLDQSLDLKIAAMVEPLSCVLHGFDRIPQIMPYTKVLIIGGGFIGSMFLQTVHLKAPEYIDVCEINQNKHALLLDMGARRVYQSVDEISRQYDLIIECTGRSDTSTQAVSLAAKGAAILLFGVPAPEAALDIPAFDIYSKELTISGSFINPFTLVDAVTYLNNQKIDVHSLISHVMPLEDIPDLLANYGEYGVTKAIIDIENS